MYKLYALVIVLLTMTTNIYSQDKPTLIYVGDPMCSWCYGFSPEFTTAMESLEDKVNLQLVMGGLRPYNKETMIELKDFLKGHWEDVHHASGQPFNYGILDSEVTPYDTEPSCRAVITMRHLKPENELAYFKAIQHNFYAENQDPMATETFASLAVKYGIDQVTFAQKFESQEMKDAVRADFGLSQQMDARSFPTVLLKKGEDYYLVAKGYLKAEVLEANVERALKM